jgi:hypothetical protein
MLPSWAMRQVGSYLGNTGRTANVVAKAALDPTRPSQVHRTNLQPYSIISLALACSVNGTSSASGNARHSGGERRLGETHRRPCKRQTVGQETAPIDSALTLGDDVTLRTNAMWLHVSPIRTAPADGASARRA